MAEAAAQLNTGALASQLRIRQQSARASRISAGTRSPRQRRSNNPRLQPKNTIVYTPADPDLIYSDRLDEAHRFAVMQEHMAEMNRERIKAMQAQTLPLVQEASEPEPEPAQNIAEQAITSGIKAYAPPGMKTIAGMSAKHTLKTATKAAKPLTQVAERAAEKWGRKIAWKFGAVGSVTEWEGAALWTWSIFGFSVSSFQVAKMIFGVNDILPFPFKIIEPDATSVTNPLDYTTFFHFIIGCLIGTAIFGVVVGFIGLIGALTALGVYAIVQFPELVNILWPFAKWLLMSAVI